MKTLKELKELGAVEEMVQAGWSVTGSTPSGALLLNGVLWVEKPSENGNGWFAGDADNMDNLLFVASV